MRKLAISLIFLCGFSSVFATEIAAPPTARRVDTVERVFDLEMPDPYRWMETNANKEFDLWMSAQGAYARAQLDAQPSRKRWEKRLVDVVDNGVRYGGWQFIQGRYYFFRALNGEQSALVVRDEKGQDRVIFDPNKASGNPTISGYSVSPDGTKVAINIGYAGNEMGEIAVYTIADGKRLADTLKPVWSEFVASWQLDSKGFFYNRMPVDLKPGEDSLQGSAVYLHRMSSPQSEDVLIVKADGSAPLKIKPQDFPSVYVTPGSKWALLAIEGARASRSVCVALLSEVVSAAANWRCLVDDKDNVQDMTLRGDTLYLLQAAGAPNRRVLALDLRNSKNQVANAKVVIPERKDRIISSISVANDALYVKSMYRGVDRIERMHYKNQNLQTVKTPFEGSIVAMLTHPLQDGALYSLQDWITPRKVYVYHPAQKNLIDTGLGQTSTVDVSGLMTEMIEATSQDGTLVPLSIIRPRNLEMNGSARVMLVGYGGYGISITPSYSATRLQWPKAGNVYAVCHVRGGGENGDAWRIGGSGPNKQRGVEDFIACAKELTKRGYSVPQRIGATSASMGGILLGGAYVTAPEAFGAMVITAGDFNTTRLAAQKNGANQYSEVGDPRTREGMQQLHAMDVNRRVRDGTKYPPILFMVGLADQRVAPWQSGKLAAQILHASPQTPVLIRTDEEIGHFATTGNAEVQEMADAFSFFETQLQ
jgi:prolyl oligopeptidase